MSDVYLMFIKCIFVFIIMPNHLTNIVWLEQVGDEGAGHFVKMVHNGIEYGDMQLICEAYHLMKDVLGMDHDEMAKVRLLYFYDTTFTFVWQY